MSLTIHASKAPEDTLEAKVELAAAFRPHTSIQDHHQGIVVAEVVEDSLGSSLLIWQILVGLVSALPNLARLIGMPPIRECTC